MIGTIKISQLPPAEAITGNENLIVNQDGDTRLTTVDDVLGIITYVNASGISTLSQGLTGSPSISVSSLNVSGVSTLGTLQVSSGIVTATSGIVTYYGDGSKLQNIISGVGIQSTGTLIGSGITTLNFIGAGNTFSVNGSTVNISIQGGASSQWVTNSSGIHTLSNVGIGTTNPLQRFQVGSINQYVPTLVAIASTIGITTTLITGISTSSITIGLEILALNNIISSGTTVTSIGSSTITIGTASLNAGIQTNVSLTFGVRNDSHVVSIAATGNVGLGTTNPTSKLHVVGDIKLDDGGSFVTTVQCVTPTANRTISFPDRTGTVALVGGSSGQAIYNNGGVLEGINTMTFDGTTVTLAGRMINSYTSVASAPSKTFTGTWFTGGTSTTTKPHFLIEPAGTTSTAWSTSGTGLGVNAASGFAGNLLDLQVGGVSQVRATSTGRLNAAEVGLVNGVLATWSNGATVSATTGIVFAWTNNEIRVAGTAFIGWASANPTAAGADLQLHRDAANTLAQRNGTNAQKTNIYDTYASATDYHRVTIATARATLSAVSGASVTAAGLIPAGAVVMGVTSKVTTALGTANGTTGYKIGTGADDDRWGAITGTAAGTTSDNRNWTAGTIECFPAATDVIVTATGGNFNGTGVIYLSVQYIAGEAD